MKFVDEIQPYKSRGREQTRRSSPRHHPIKQTQHHHQLRLQQQHTGQVFFPAFGKFNYRVTVASMNNWLMTLTSLVSRLGNWQRGVGWISPASMEGLDSIHIYIYIKNRWDWGFAGLTFWSGFVCQTYFYIIFLF